MLHGERIPIIWSMSINTSLSLKLLGLFTEHVAWLVVIWDKVSPWHLWFPLPGLLGLIPSPHEPNREFFISSPWLGLGWILLILGCSCGISRTPGKSRGAETMRFTGCMRSGEYYFFFGMRRCGVLLNGLYGIPFTFLIYEPPPGLCRIYMVQLVPRQE